MAFDASEMLTDASEMASGESDLSEMGDNLTIFFFIRGLGSMASRVSFNCWCVCVCQCVCERESVNVCVCV